MLYNLHHDVDDVEKMVYDDDYDWQVYFKDCLYEVNMYKDLITLKALPAFHIFKVYLFFITRKSAIRNNDSKSRKMTTKRVRINELSNKTRRHITLV